MGLSLKFCLKLDFHARQGFCLGCGRTIDEIARWTGMSAAERSRILNELPKRRMAQGVTKMIAAMG